MRKVLALVIAAAAIAVVAGLALPADAVKTRSASLSTTQLTDELTAIDHSAPFQCYLKAQPFTNSGGVTTAPPLPGVSAQAWSNVAALDWTYERAKQLAAVQFVESRDASAFSSTSLAVARASLSNTIYRTIALAFQTSTQAAPFTCPGAIGGNQTLASLPAWFVDEQVQAQAATLGLEALLTDAVPASGPALVAWYHLHASLFDTTCLSLILVSDLQEATSVKAMIAAGLTIPEAVKRYSLDPTSKAKHGAIGCYSPTSSAFQTIWQSVNSVPLGHVTVFLSNGQYLLIGPTKRTPNTYAAISAVVASQASRINVQQAAQLAVGVQERANVRVDPSIGTWVSTALGGTIVAPGFPPTSSLANPAANVPTSVATGSTSTP